MEKRKIALIVAILGIVLIVISKLSTTFAYTLEDDKELFIKENLKSSFKKCLKDYECLENDIKIETLINKGYVSSEVINKLNGYDLTSLIKYPSYEIELLKQ